LKYKIKFKNLKFIKQIGHGTFGECWLAYEPYNAIKIAVKILDSSVFKRISSYESFEDIPKSFQEKLNTIQEELKFLKYCNNK